MRAIENQTGKQLADVLLDERCEVNVFPRLVRAAAARQKDEPRHDSRHLHDRVQWVAPPARLCSYEQIVAAVQEMREWMAGIYSQRRQHRKNFL